MLIYRALLKYGYSNFSLVILEYCDTKDLLPSPASLAPHPLPARRRRGGVGLGVEREKYYMLLLKSEYNISKEPASPFLGFKHSEETKARISASNSLSPCKRLRAGGKGN
jgi:group I intron endonuclease